MHINNFCTFKINTNLFVAILILLLFLSQSALANTCNSNTPTQDSDRFTQTGVEDGNILDTHTGLIWRRCSLGQIWDSTNSTCQLFSERKNWRESLTEVQNFNADQFAIGQPDNWRMPNIKELASLMDLSCVNYAINTTIFPNPESAYWSSTPHAALIYSLPIVDENDQITGYQDENLIWSVSTLTGKEKPELWNKTVSVILVRNQGS